MVLGAGMVGSKFRDLRGLIRFRVRIIYLTIREFLHYNVGADYQKFQGFPLLHWRNLGVFALAFALAQHTPGVLSSRTYIVLVFITF